jgi:hypothetical protein
MVIHGSTASHTVPTIIARRPKRMANKACWARRRNRRSGGSVEGISAAYTKGSSVNQFHTSNEAEFTFCEGIWMFADIAGLLLAV